MSVHSQEIWILMIVGIIYADIPSGGAVFFLLVEVHTQIQTVVWGHTVIVPAGQIGINLIEIGRTCFSS